MRETYTLSKLYDNVKGLKGGELILSHVGVNDIQQGQNVDDCVKKYTKLLEDMTVKGHTCIVSLLTPTKDQILNTEILRFNDLLSKTLTNKPGIYICENKNLSRGKSFNLHNNYGEGDNLHINKFMGTWRLAWNLKYVLCSASNIKVASHQDSTGNSRSDTLAARNQNMSFVDMTKIVTAVVQAVQQNQNSGRQGYPYFKRKPRRGRQF